MAIMGFLWRWSKPLLAFNAVLVLYLIISSKIKPEASNISDKFPMREDVGHHSVRFFPHTRRTLTNGKLCQWTNQIVEVYCSLRATYGSYIVVGAS